MSRSILNDDDRPSFIVPKVESTHPKEMLVVTKGDSIEIILRPKMNSNKPHWVNSHRSVLFWRLAWNILTQIAWYPLPGCRWCSLDAKI